MRLCNAGIIIGVFIIALGCTRENKTGSLRVIVPLQKNVSVLQDYNLEIAIANVQISGRPPVVARIESRDEQTPISFGNALTLNIPSLPSNVPILVQVLSVYKSSAAGDLKFYYGDRDVRLSGEAQEVTINGTQSGSSSGQETQIAGRYLTGSNTGPTGKLQLLFEVGGGKPSMLVDESWIVNGWFEAFAVQGAKFDLVVQPSVQKLFDDLTVDGSGNVAHSLSTTPLTAGAQRLLMTSPASFRSDGHRVEPQPAVRYLLGYFDNNSDGNVNDTQSARRVLYANSREAVPNSYTDRELQNPLNYDGTGGASNGVRHQNGGIAKPLNEVFSLNGTDCTAAKYNSGNCLIFMHTKLGFGREGFSGQRLPFRTMNPLSSRDSFTEQRFFEDCPDGGQPCLLIKWDLLPDAGSVLEDIEVWYKSSSAYSYNEGGDDFTCDKLSSLGFSKHGAVKPPQSTEKYYFKNSDLSRSNNYQYNFYLCPRASFAGSTQYIGRPLRVDSCGGSCGTMEHLGWAPAGTGNISSGFTHSVFSKVTALGLPEQTYIPVTLARSPAGLNVGDEVLVHVTARGLAQSCGKMDGMDIPVGSYDFARVVDIQSGSNAMKLSRGTFLDQMHETIAATNLNASHSHEQNHCLVQIVKVLHYNHLTLNYQVSPSNLTLDGSGNVGGGILPLRVNGTLTISDGSGLVADGAGFGGGPVGSHGTGDTGLNSATQKGGTSGGGLGLSTMDSGGGGGGYGSGGGFSNGGTEGGQGLHGGIGHVRMIHGGGGGSGGTGMGANGGGIVFLMADKLSVSGTVIVSANGADVAAGINGGAGGGGSAYLFARTVSGSGTIHLRTNGGAASTGGRGGGGSVEKLVCSSDSVAFSTSADKGTAGADAGAAGGWLNLMNPNNDYRCRSN